MNEQETQEKIKLQNQILEVEKMVKNYMTNEAIARYGNLKSAHPEKALGSIALIARLIQENKITEKITDDQFKQLLMNMEPGKRESKISRR